MVKAWLKMMSTTLACPNGHKSVIMLPNGRQRCMDCGWEG